VVVGAATPAGVVFAKAAGDADVCAEVTTIGLAAEVGVPVPRVLATGADSRLPGRHWFATAEVEGVNWSIDNPTRPAQTLPDLACCLARLHRVQPPGFGPLDPAGHGTFESWTGWVLQTARSCLDALAEAGHTTDAFRTGAIKVFEKATPTIRQGILAHGDLSESETFLDPDSGRVTGIVDWGAAIVADPIFGLATISAGGPADDPRPTMVLPTLLDHYLPQTGPDRAHVHRTLPLYRAHNAISNAEWSCREGVPWTDDLLAAADAWFREV
jgi:aminoglycoside phosphotransferase (APT) family kinase protein